MAAARERGQEEADAAAGIITSSPGHDASYPWRQIGTSAAFLAARQAAGRRSARGPRAMLPIDEAVALYLQLLRNANHGFTPQRDADERRDQILFMAHDGNIPGDIAFLPYLYWLDTLAHPHHFRNRLRPPAEVRMSPASLVPDQSRPPPASRASGHRPR
jgi:hypothetical protein